MRYLKKRRRVIGKEVDLHQEDPMSGVANLFDVGVVFIVGLIGALISAYSLLDFLSPKTEITMVKNNDDGRVEIVTKKGKQIKVEKVTDKNCQGEGTRLGTAYRLKYRIRKHVSLGLFRGNIRLKTSEATNVMDLFR